MMAFRVGDSTMELLHEIRCTISSPGLSPNRTSQVMVRHLLQRRRERSKVATTCWPSGVSVSTAAVSVDPRFDGSYSSQIMKPVGRKPLPPFPPPVLICVPSDVTLRDS